MRRRVAARCVSQAVKVGAKDLKSIKAGHVGEGSVNEGFLVIEQEILGWSL